jgi:flagellar biosynthetic protein FliR
MTGLTLAIGEQTLSAFLLATSRTSGFVLVAPPFNTRAVPGRVRGLVALGLAIPLSVWTAPGAPALGSPLLATQSVLQVVAGAAMGFLVLAAVATVQAVGDLVDLAGGFNLSLAMDPLMLAQASVMGRLHQIVAVTLLFVSDGHLMVLHGLARGVAAMPAPELNLAALAAASTHALASLVAGAAQVAGPVLASMLTADIALGLLTRAAPALNAFSLGFPLKILLTLLMVGLVVAELPDVVRSLVEQAATSMLNLTGG